ncbi:MAG: TIGR03089 family protein [Marmoricola sp.]
MVAKTFGQVLEARLQSGPGQPLVTFYDDVSGERTELSVTTYANWVAKTAGVFVDDLGLDTGDRAAVDLPTHWLGPVFLGAAWLAGLTVTDGPRAEAVVQGPDGSGIEGDQRLGCALLPFAVASREPMADGVLDFGTLWPGQPDAFVGLPAGPDEQATEGRSQGALLDHARSLEYAAGERVLTDLNPVTVEGRDLFLGTLVGGGSVIWVARPDQQRWSGRASSERATRMVRVAGSQPPRS